MQQPTKASSRRLPEPDYDEAEKAIWAQNPPSKKGGRKPGALGGMSNAPPPPPPSQPPPGGNARKSPDLGPQVPSGGSADAWQQEQHREAWRGIPPSSASADHSSASALGGASTPAGGGLPSLHGGLFGGPQGTLNELVPRTPSRLGGERSTPTPREDAYDMAGRQHYPGRWGPPDGGGSLSRSQAPGADWGHGLPTGPSELAPVRDARQPVHELLLGRGGGGAGAGGESTPSGRDRAGSGAPLRGGWHHGH